MGFEYLTNLALGQAKEGYLRMLEAAGYGHKTEVIPVGESCGRISACAVYAQICAPHYAASAMDGIALRAEDSFGATETTPVCLRAGQFLPVDTGDPIAEPYDAVIMVEDILRQDDGSVVLHSAAAPWQHIRQVGEDVCAGEMILPSYVPVTPAGIGAMIAGGVLEIEVIKKPAIGIIPTGDEIVPPCVDPRPGDILEFNSSIFSAMASTWGAKAVIYPIVPDKLCLIRDAVARAAAECDIVLLNAGSSAGREDFSAAAVRQLGQVFCHGVAIKPGKPTILGAIGATPVIGIPGYPVSGIIVMEQLVRPLIDRWLKRPAAVVHTVNAVLSRSVVSGLKYQEFVRVRLGYVGDKLMASPLSRGSGVVTSFMKADGILDIPQDTEGYQAGESVPIRLLSSEAKLRNTLMVIGSHDPLLDELADMIHRADPNVYINSVHVGSMGGIMAMRRGESHAAGCHLLDTETGGYNCSFVKKYFPKGGVRLVRCVGRQQGLMVGRGNPLGLTKFADISRSGIRYVNRQKGSGTRVLTDYLCGKERVDPGGIYGYEREELTHTSVAAQIASGSADAGMGIYSAAKLYDLDFVPVCIEEYDLLIPDHAWDTPMISQMLDILKSDAFREKLQSMGGYTLDAPGEVISLD